MKKKANKLLNKEIVVSYEKPQKGNPNQFTISQHFHTAHLISKFYNSADKVEIKFLGSDEIEPVSKDSKRFVAKRAWDQKSEHGMMADIEKSFHDEVNNLKSIDQRNHHAISKYFILWRIRHHIAISENQDSDVKGVTGSNLTKEQEENIEKAGGSFFRDNGQVPYRFTNAISLIQQLDEQLAEFANCKWGLLQSEKGEFVVADCYQGLMLLPISPELAFCVGVDDMIIDTPTLASINKQSIEVASNFCFARDWNMCPLG